MTEPRIYGHTTQGLKERTKMADRKVSLLKTHRAPTVPSDWTSAVRYQEPNLHSSPILPDFAEKKIKIKHFCLFPAHYSEKTILQVCINNLIGSVSLKPDISFSFCENTQSITKMLICREAVHWEKPYSIISILNDKKQRIKHKVNFMFPL